MAKDPAFLFYPGDYLRDTQCLSEDVQVAYDRIMCEHMRNICISQQQLNFFTKKLSEEEKQELAAVLTKVDGGYQIDWVVNSIYKRRAYSESRSNNRSGKNKKTGETYKEDMSKISKTYVNHMVNENENAIDKEELENRDSVKGEGKKEEQPVPENLQSVFVIPEMLSVWKIHKSKYIVRKEVDFPALRKIGELIAEGENVDLVSKDGLGVVTDTWGLIAEFIVKHKLYKDFMLSQIEKYFQAITSAMVSENESPPPGKPPQKDIVQHNYESLEKAKRFIQQKFSKQNAAT